MKIASLNFPDPDLEIVNNLIETELDSPLNRLCEKRMSGEEIVELLQQYQLLPQLQRELIIDAELMPIACSDEEMLAACKNFYQQHQIGI
jgi:hypothetical protein